VRSHATSAVLGCSCLSGNVRLDSISSPSTAPPCSAEHQGAVLSFWPPLRISSAPVVVNCSSANQTLPPLASAQIWTRLRASPLLVTAAKTTALSGSTTSSLSRRQGQPGRGRANASASGMRWLGRMRNSDETEVGRDRCLRHLQRRPPRPRCHTNFYIAKGGRIRIA
jgi:hypothetical protein